MTFTLDHIHLRSADPDMAAGFYVQKMGATEISRTSSGKMLRVVVELGGLTLFIETIKGGEGNLPAPRTLGLEHIGLCVPDLNEAAARLKAEGVEFVVEPKEVRPGVSMAFIQGPDGVQIELIERSPV